MRVPSVERSDGTDNACQRTILALVLTAVMVPAIAKDKDAQCLIRQNGVTTYSDACLFHLEKGGSFSIRRPDAKPILPNITDISVTIVAAGFAEVRGLTTDGINSRWGSAVRSKVDSACWTGSDFEICAY
jgi:hypothetical protein